MRYNTPMRVWKEEPRPRLNELCSPDGGLIAVEMANAHPLLWCPEGKPQVKSIMANHRRMEVHYCLCFSSRSSCCTRTPSQPRS